MWVDGGEGFAELLRGFERSAWRWECQGTYPDPAEREPMQAWRDGRLDAEFMTEWLAQIRRLRAAGQVFERVRMLTEPLTEYLRWMISLTPLNVEAGEDIRWIAERDARQLDVPAYDFYLFDDRIVARLHFDETGVAGVELSDEPGTVAEHRRWRNQLWRAATPHDEKFAATRSP
ncbi:DUF6879 family protein [Amycolatopsis solani]|uniref:DUF6879 family protein n=1 Tax=Amycolatopsis solani TaxID=3028615 RepID=UPI0025AF2C22|nr:DUF6879 family protein [Amycolatopsis sp. MEP2-6]